MTNTETKINDCLKPIIEKLGYVLYDVIYEKEGSENYLRIFIDKKDGISINDCENVNNSITDILDEKDFIKNSYMLEVSSPGLEKRLRSDEHLKQNIGNKIKIHTFKNEPNLKTKEIIGILKDYDNKNITIEIEDSENSIIVEIEKSNISKMSTVYDWN